IKAAMLPTARSTWTIRATSLSSAAMRAALSKAASERFRRSIGAPPSSPSPSEVTCLLMVFTGGGEGTGDSFFPFVTVFGGALKTLDTMPTLQSARRAMSLTGRLAFAHMVAICCSVSLRAMSNYSLRKTVHEHAVCSRCQSNDAPRKREGGARIPLRNYYDF